MMKLILPLVALAICVTFRNVQAGPVPSLAYPWTSWLAIKPPPPFLNPLYAAQLQAAAAAAAAAGQPPAAPASDDPSSPDALANYLIARSILPAAPEKKKSKSKKKDSSKEDETSGDPTTTKVPLIEVGDFWAPPTIAPNVTSPLVMDPAYWAAKKTMFISKLFAALAKQVLNSTGTVTTTTPSPDAALLQEIDTVLLTDVARSVGEDPSAPALPPTKAMLKKEAKKTAKADKKAKAKTKGIPPFLLAKKAKATPAPATPAAPVETEDQTAHPTLDYALLAKALLS